MKKEKKNGMTVLRNLIKTDIFGMKMLEWVLKWKSTISSELHDHPFTFALSLNFYTIIKDSLFQWNKI